MAYFWMLGAIYYRINNENKVKRQFDNPPILEIEPPVSLIVPCFNEGDNVHDTIEFLLKQEYSDFEVIAVNDGSSDDTGKYLDELAIQNEKLRVVHLASNQGKAVALKTATLIANNEYLICIDGDALLDKHATRWMVRHFVAHPDVGAVTGNPRIRNRTSILGKFRWVNFQPS